MQLFPTENGASLTFKPIHYDGKGVGTAGSLLINELKNTSQVLNFKPEG